MPHAPATRNRMVDNYIILRIGISNGDQPSWVDMHSFGHADIGTQHEEKVS